MARALDSDVEAAIREALADPNASYPDIAERVGRSASTIRRYANRWGLERDGRVVLADDQHEKIRRMLRAGCWTRRQIAKGVGCSPSTVRDVAAALGIDRTNQRFPRFQKRDETL